MRGAAIGFMIGAAIPVIYGAYVLNRSYAYIAAQPPDTAACGMPILFAWACILFGGPIVGIFGAGTGFVFSLISELIRHKPNQGGSV